MLPCLQNAGLDALHIQTIPKKDLQGLPAKVGCELIICESTDGNLVNLFWDGLYLGWMKTLCSI